MSTHISANLPCSSLIYIFFLLPSLSQIVGEIVEWYGFAIASNSVTAYAFAFYTICAIGPRALDVSVILMIYL